MVEPNLMWYVQSVCSDVHFIHNLIKLIEVVRVRSHIILSLLSFDPRRVPKTGRRAAEQS